MWWMKSGKRTFESGFGPEHKFLGTWTRELESGEKQRCDVYWSPQYLTARYGEEDCEYMAAPWACLILEYIRRNHTDYQRDNLLGLCCALEPHYNITVRGVNAEECGEDDD